MKLLVTLFCFDRPDILRHCLATIMSNASRFDAEILAINDGSNSNVEYVLRETQMIARRGNVSFNVLNKSLNKGMANSTKIALAYARAFEPDFWFLAESDYIFQLECYQTVIYVFENTEEGRMCLGIVGYDNPNTYHEIYTDEIFPDYMRKQLGEDNVNRKALYKGDWKFGDEGPVIELASNTTTTCYLNWKHINEIAKEFPEIHSYLNRAVDPIDIPGYGPSTHFKEMRMFDDGMLSHSINLVWNRWAIKHGVDRDKFAAWLNIKPSVAQAVTGGGIHAEGCPELKTQSLSPTWKALSL